MLVSQAASNRISQMPDDLPLYAPSHLACEPIPVFEVWRLLRGGHLLICELRNKQISVDVLTLGGERSPLLYQRCASHAHGEFVAMSYRRTFLREGWTERRQLSP